MEIITDYNGNLCATIDTDSAAVINIWKSYDLRKSYIPFVDIFTTLCGSSQFAQLIIIISLQRAQRRKAFKNTFGSTHFEEFFCETNPIWKFVDILIHF